MDGPGSSKPDWQLSCTKSRERLSHLFFTNLRSDCTFLVGDEEPETITAHKFVLAMCSPVFETMFYGSMPENKGPVRVPDVQPQAFRTMLQFLYTDDANLNSYQEASDVYCVAKKYMVPCIQKRCVNHLQWNITPSNACFAHEFASLFDEHQLLKATLKTFKRRTKEVLIGESFYEAHIKTVVALFSQTELDIDSEMDLFKALEKYAAETMGITKLKRSCESPRESNSPSKRPKIENDASSSQVEDNQQTDVNIDADQNEEEKRLIAEIRLAIAHIRFLTLSAQAFAPAASSALLTEEEALALMLNMAGVTVSLPPQISASKERRRLRSVTWSPDYAGTSSGTSTSDPQKTSAPNTPAKTVPAEDVFVAMCSFTVMNFKMRKRNLRSEPFYTDNLQWHINIIMGSEMRPDGEPQRTVGVLVECAGPQTGKSDWSCTARVVIEIRHKNNTQYIRRSFNNAYNRNLTMNGYRNLVPFSTVINDYLYGGSLRVNVTVTATITKQ